MKQNIIKLYWHFDKKKHTDFFTNDLKYELTNFVDLYFSQSPF